MTPGLRWALVVGIEALLIVLLLPFGFVFTGTPALHLFQLVVLGIVGGMGWIAVVSRPTALSPYLVLAPLPMLAALVITAFVSPYPSLSWPATWVTAAYAGVFWLLAMQASHPTGRRNLLAVIAIVVILALISFFFAVLLEWRDWLSLGFPVTTLPLRPSNTGGLALIPTWLADLVALGSPIVIANLWGRGARPAAVALAVVVLVAIVLTGTRSVLLFVAGVGVIAAVIAMQGRVGRRPAIAILTGVIAVGIVGAVIVFGSSRSLDEGRSSAYASAVARMSEAPLLGAGPGTYGVKRMSDPVDVIGHLAFPDAHNIVLNTLAESGFVGLLGLVATVALVGLAIRSSWRASPNDRLIIAGALFGLSIFAAHGMVDVVFGLVGIVIVAIAVVATAATNTAPIPATGPRPAYLRAATGVGLLVMVLISVAVLRTETNAGAVAAADAALETNPQEALARSRGATDDASDLVPGWWVQMVALDSAGDAASALAAARRMTELEGFGQQWVSLAVLASRQGDTATARDSIVRATASPPIDPMVELNAIALFEASGDRVAVEAAARRLLTVQPDIERIASEGPPALAEAIAAVRADVAIGRMSEGDLQVAFLVALSGEDRVLADDLLNRSAGAEALPGVAWSSVVAAWFGDATQRANLEATTVADPALEGSLWAWRLAGRACDEAGMTFWERALEIGFSLHPTTPNELLVEPTGWARTLPILYPTFVWKQDHPQRPYVGGTWTYSSGRPICVAP